MFGQDSQLQQGGVLDQADQALADHPENSQNAMNQLRKSKVIGADNCNISQRIS